MTLTGSHASIHMEVEIARDEITDGIIHNFAIGSVELRNKLQQNIAALDLKRFRNLSRRVRGADRRTRNSQVIAPLEQVIQDRTIESFRDVAEQKNIFRQDVDEIGNRTRIGPH